MRAAEILDLRNVVFIKCELVHGCWCVSLDDEMGRHIEQLSLGSLEEVESFVRGFAGLTKQEFILLTGTPPRYKTFVEKRQGQASYGDETLTGITDPEFVSFLLH